MKSSSNEHQLVFGTACRLSPQKDLKTLLFSWQEFKRRSSLQSVLRIIGEGEDKNSLINMTIDLKIPDVIWMKPTKNLDSFYSSLDVFVLSTNYEGFGLVLLEAMQNSLPILASNNTSVPEVLGFNHSGLFKTGSVNSLVKAMLSMTNRIAREKNITLGLERLKQFEPTLMASQIGNIYHSITSKE